jgi:hypothetical protein
MEALGTGSRAALIKGDFLAKRNETTPPSDQASQKSTTPASATGTVETGVVAFAEQLGRIVGTVQAKADGWLDPRILRDQLTRVRDGAADLLTHLGSETPAATTAPPAQTGGDAPQRSAATARPAKTVKARSGGRVDAPGKTHRKPPASPRGIKHSDQTIPKLKAAQARRRTRRG